MDELPLLIPTSLNSSQAYFLEQLSEEEFWKYACELAAMVPTHVSLQEYLICELSRGRCIIPLTALYEVMPSPHQFTFLPASPEWMLGLAAWRGETIAVVDLSAYLFESRSELLPEGMLLIAHHPDTPLALHVPAIGLTTALQDEEIQPLADALPWHTPVRSGVVQGVYAEALVLDVSVLLTDLVQRIGITASHG